MSEVETEKSTMGGVKATAILAVTAVAGIWALATIGPVIAAHALLSTIALGGGAVAVGYKKERRDKILSFGSKVKNFYKDVFKGFSDGWGSATKWAEAKEAAAKAKQAPEAASGNSPLISKEAANDFEAAATGAKVTVKATPAPAQKPAARPTM